VNASAVGAARLILILLLLGSQTYLLLRALSYLRTKESARHLRFVVWIAFSVFNLPMFYLTFFWSPKVVLTNFLTWAAVYPFYVWQIAGLMVFLLIIVGKIIKLPVIGAVTVLKRIPLTRDRIAAFRKNARFQKFDQSRRVFLRTTFWGASAYVVVGSGYGVFYQNQFELVQKQLRLSRLPASLSGLTMGLMSDIHSGPYMSKDEIDEYVTALNSLQPDIVFLPGDFVTMHQKEIFPVIESLSEMKARYGVYGCLGNHEFYSRAPDDITRRLEDAGVKMLRNENVTLDIEGNKLAIIGIDDLGHGENFPAAVRAVPPDSVKVLMTHKPYFFPRAAEAGMDLVLAGHTHGGQLVFVKVGEFALAPATFVSKYVAGLYEIGDSLLYVSRGVGTIGVPFRINCPPEVTLFTLT
jgi:predicted MPP superfamily phosphohydrolase